MPADARSSTGAIRDAGPSLMPVALVREDATGARVPVTTGRFWIGRDLDCHLVLRDPRVGPRHARLRYLKGEFVLTATEDERVYVNGKSVPMMPLRDGDVVQLTRPDDDPPVRLRFSNPMEGSFVPEGASWAEAWSNHPESRAARFGPWAWGEGAPIGSDGRSRRVQREAEGDSLIVKVLGRVPSFQDGDRYLRTLTALAGGPHDALAPVIDGGLANTDDGYVRWMATRFETGQPASDLVRIGGIDPGQAVAVLCSLSEAVAHLHARGVIHRDISPGNVIVRPAGAGVLIDFGHAVRAEEGIEPSPGVLGTPGYIAPEVVVEGTSATPAVDVYGIAAVGYALVAGRPPAQGGDVLETLAQAGALPPKLEELGRTVPGSMQNALLSGLLPRPTDRPTAKELSRDFAIAAAQIGIEA